MAGKEVVGEAVRISLESGILSKHTAFVAVEERDEATEGTMKVRKITIEKGIGLPSTQAPPLRLSSISGRGGTYLQFHLYPWISN